jgi:hypothetical protein
MDLYQNDFGHFRNSLMRDGLRRDGSGGRSSSLLESEVGVAAGMSTTVRGGVGAATGVVRQEQT